MFREVRPVLADNWERRLAASHTHGATPAILPSVLEIGARSRPSSGPGRIVNSLASGAVPPKLAVTSGWRCERHGCDGGLVVITN